MNGCCKIRYALLAAAVAACGCVSRDCGDGAVLYVDDFDLSGASCGQGKSVQARMSVDGHPLTMSKKTYARGFGARPESAVAFRTNGRVASFDAIVGLDDDAAKAGSGKSYGKPTASFAVWADGRIV